MADEKRDPLFDDVEKWRDELDDRFVKQFGIIVTAGFVSLFIMAVVMMLFNGCAVESDRPPVTLATLATPVSTLVDHITVATTTTTTTTP